jgi:hypothetical protein
MVPQKSANFGLTSGSKQSAKEPLKVSTKKVHGRIDKQRSKKDMIVKVPCLLAGLRKRRKAGDC